MALSSPPLEFPAGRFLEPLRSSFQTSDRPHASAGGPPRTARRRSPPRMTGHDERGPPLGQHGAESPPDGDQGDSSAVQPPPPGPAEKACAAQAGLGRFLLDLSLGQWSSQRISVDRSRVTRGPKSPTEAPLTSRPGWSADLPAGAVATVGCGYCRSRCRGRGRRASRRVHRAAGYVPAAPAGGLGPPSWSSPLSWFLR